MDAGIPEAQETRPRGDTPVAGDHPWTCRKAAGRKARPCIEAETGARELIGLLRGVFPGLPRWFAELPDARRREMCKYTAEHLWSHVLLMFLCRSGSRNAFDHTRNSGGMAFGVAALCGQPWDDPRFENAPTVTCSDNAARHASRTDPAQVAQLPARMIRTLLDRRAFDQSRLDDGSLVVVVDGSVQEKCRKGFDADGKVSGGAKYRYVMQASI